MGVWVVVALPIVLDVAAALWGHDSRDGRGLEMRSQA
jgi:hypothetical protein